MSQSLSGAGAILAALQDQTSQQDALRDPWQFVRQFGITPQTLFAGELGSQLPGFDEAEGNIAGYTYPNSIITVTAL